MIVYGSLVTAVGAAQLTNAFGLGGTVSLTQFAVGTGENDAEYNPVETQTELKAEVYRGAINSISTVAGQPNILEINCIVPVTVGGWYVREVGIFDDVGNLIVISNYPESYKPLVAEGAAQDFSFKILMATTNTAQVELKVDPAIVLASKQFVNDALANLDLASSITDITGLQAALDAKAASAHLHMIADVTGLQTTLDSKSNTDHTHTNPVFHIRHQEANGVNGGTANTGNNIRNINTVVENDISGASLDALNRSFTIPAGTYKFIGSGASYLCDQNKLILYNVTDAVSALIGPNAWSYDNPGTSTAHLVGRLTLADSKTFELRHYCANGQGTNGFGASVTGAGTPEIYAELFIEKVG